MAEHRRKAQRFPRNKVEYDMLVKDSAIACHALDTGHAIDFTNTKILRQGLESPSERLCAEAIEIMKSHSAINRLDGIELSGVCKTLSKST